MIDTHVVIKNKNIKSPDKQVSLQNNEKFHLMYINYNMKVLK